MCGSHLLCLNLAKQFEKIEVKKDKKQGKREEGKEEKQGKKYSKKAYNGRTFKNYGNIVVFNVKVVMTHPRLPIDR